MLAAQTLDNMHYTMKRMDPFIAEDDDATPRLPSKPTFESLRLPSFTRTLSTSSSSSSSFDSSSDESALPSPTDSYGRSSKYSSTHSQLIAALASNPHRQIRPRIFARESSSTSTTSEAEWAASFPQKQAASGPKLVSGRRAMNKFEIIGHPSTILASPMTSMPSMSRSDSSSSSSSDQSTPTDEKSRTFPTFSRHSRSRKQPITIPALRPRHIDASSPLVFGAATPPVFITPKSSPLVECGEWVSGTAGLQIYQVLSMANEKLDVEATLRNKLNEAGQGMNRDVWERRMARRGRKAL